MTDIRRILLIALAVWTLTPVPPLQALLLAVQMAGYWHVVQPQDAHGLTPLNRGVIERVKRNLQRQN